ncbi:uncharacterized protein EAE97_007727 [Botrytis byssoidea]|uniref:Uncharacterized protein n=1 Tax=Botrytis byssoidea TaxID=139641 RepID=A0A9P5IG36_9HELO|nr:uncharacterized protein EAE97_007727 [Botrytis byssoidea]KAF7937931.1 hypothetical protein EAE97_007727 [Botrytis byssoidea]
MSQTSINNVLSRDRKREQCNFDLRTRPRAENTTRNKVEWEKNILPGGRVDWVIVGFSAPVLIEKKVDAQVDAREIFEGRKKKNSQGVIVAAVPIELPSTIENDVLDLLIGSEDSRDLSKEGEETGAITTKATTGEVINTEKNKTPGRSCEAIESRETSETHEESLERMTVSENGGKPIPFEGRNDGGAPHTTVDLFNSQSYKSPVAHRNLPSVSRRSRDGKNDSSDSCLRLQSNQESRATRSTSSPKRQLSNYQSRVSSPKSTPGRRPHPAEIMKSFRSSVSTSSNSHRTVYSPIFNTQNSKARLTTSILPRTSQTVTRRPKTTVTVASRMITHALGVRAVPRVLEFELESK